MHKEIINNHSVDAYIINCYVCYKIYKYLAYGLKSVQKDKSSQVGRLSGSTSTITTDRYTRFHIQYMKRKEVNTFSNNLKKEVTCPCYRVRRPFFRKTLLANQYNARKHNMPAHVLHLNTNHDHRNRM